MPHPTPSATPHPLDAHIGFWMRLVSNHVSARFSERLEQNGVTVSEWVVLRLLYEDDIATHATLIDTLGMTKGATSKIVAKLEHKQWLTRRRSRENAKSQTLSLTARGRALVPALAALADQNDADFFGALTAEESHALLSLLKTIARAHNLKTIPVS